jgi:hypothetical protein
MMYAEGISGRTHGGVVMTGKERLERASAVLREQPRLDEEERLCPLCQALADLIDIAARRLDGGAPAAPQERQLDRQAL